MPVDANNRCDYHDVLTLQGHNRSQTRATYLLVSICCLSIHNSFLPSLGTGLNTLLYMVLLAVHRSCLLTRPVRGVECLKASISHKEHTCSGYMNILTRRAKAMSAICVPSMSRIVASFSMLCTMSDGHSVLHNQCHVSANNLPPFSRDLAPFNTVNRQNHKEEITCGICG